MLEPVGLEGFCGDSVLVKVSRAPGLSTAYAAACKPVASPENAENYTTERFSCENAAGDPG